MVNSPQSSRRKKLQSILPNIAVANTKDRSYTITGNPTESGKTDIHFNEMQKATSANYVLLIVALAGGLYLMYKGSDEI